MWSVFYVHINIASLSYLFVFNPANLYNIIAFNVIQCETSEKTEIPKIIYIYFSHRRKYETNPYASILSLYTYINVSFFTRCTLPFKRFLYITFCKSADKIRSKNVFISFQIQNACFLALVNLGGQNCDNLYVIIRIEEMTKQPLIFINTLFMCS